MKITKKEELNTTFDKIKFGECFKIKNTEKYFMKTSLVNSPITDVDWNSVDLSDGSFSYFIASQNVVKVNCELIIR